MAYRELVVVEVAEIIRRWRLGLGIRTIAEVVDVDRKTVRRYVDAARVLGLARTPDLPVTDEELALLDAALRPGAPSVPGDMRQHCRAHRTLLESWVAEGCRGPKLVSLLYRHTGVLVPLRTLQRFVEQDLGDAARKRTATVRVVDPPPGEQVEVDFCTLGVVDDAESGTRRKLHALVVIASRSRYTFAWPTWRMDQAAVIAGLEAAWGFFGGTFRVVVIDNLKAVITTADPLHPRVAEDFVEYALARGLEVDAARVRRPQDKPRVERFVSYFRDDWFRGERITDLADAREHAATWCRDRAGLRVHGTTQQHPREAFEAEEAPCLRPVIGAWNPPRWTSAKVGRDGMVSVSEALYSVPHSLRGLTLRVREDRQTVKLYRSLTLVKMHLRVERGQSQVDVGDLPPEVAELARRDRAGAAQRAVACGPSVGELAARVLDGPLSWTRMRHVHRLLRLCERYGDATVDEACRRALDLDVTDVTRIQRMLEKGVLAPSPTWTPPAAVASIVPLRFARSHDEYRTLRHPALEGAPDAPD